MLTIIFFFLSIALTRAANPNGGNGPTAIFQTRHADNSNNYYFVPNTFLLTQDPCTVINNRAEYLSVLVNNGVVCVGQWCNGNFGTKPQRTHYEMEHIVDVVETEFPDCNKNILGNLVMAFGIWNNQVGQLNSKGVAFEKKEIYGSIYNLARANVAKCCVTTPPSSPQNNPIFIIQVSLGICIIVCAASFFAWKAYYRTVVIE